MVSEALAKDVVREMGHMPVDLQQRVVDFSHALADSCPKDTPGTEMIKFAGSFSSKDQEEISAAIEQGCENVDPDAW